MNLSVRVQHHPARAALLPGLLDALAGFDDVDVVTDPRPDDRPETWRTHRACLESLHPDAAHLVVIQDDAVPCTRFAERTLEVLARKPDDLIVLFAPGFGFIKRRLVEAKRRGEHLALLPHTAFVPLVATAYPRAIVERLLAWADGDGWPAASARALRGSDDGIVATFARSSRMHVWASVPCLVDHRDELPSVARPAHRAGAHRRAALL